MKIRSTLIQYFLLCTCILFINTVFSQEEIETKKDTIAHSLEEALKNPGDIIILDLRKQKLKELPNDFNDLINLKTLYLDKNKLKTLPRSLASCKKLEYLSIANNKFTTFPMIICYLSRLQTLDISTNEIPELQDCLKELIHLENIYMVGNEISTIPESLSDLDIKEIDMRMIQMNEKEQNAIRDLFPNATIKFSKPCNCFEEEDLEEELEE